MAKARAILKRRRAVRNIKKITKTMQMIATAKFQKVLRQVVGTKPYTLKVRELVSELAASAGNIEHPMLRKIDASNASGKVAVIVLTSDRGLAGGYNGTVLRCATRTIREVESAGKQVDLYVAGKKGHAFFAMLKRPIIKVDSIGDLPTLARAEQAAATTIERFVNGEYDAIYLVYMNFISTGVQRPDSMLLLPLSGLEEALERVELKLAQAEAQLKAGALDTKRTGEDVKVEQVDLKSVVSKVEYDFMPDAKALLDELLPLTVTTAMYQAVLDAKASEHVARMVAMKSATDNADKMGKALAMQYNRARQSQITTELSEIMGGVEAMK